MADAHTPTLASFELAEPEEAAVAVALELDDPWNHETAQPPEIRPRLKSVKYKLSDFHLQRQNGTCCYCRSILQDLGPFVRDREHILPKKHFKHLSYAPFNISVSCKRCNIEIKRDDTSFVVDPDSISDDAQNSDRYKIVHPNFDKWEEHLSRHQIQENNNHLIMYDYDKGSAKAKYTYGYFRLKSLTSKSLQEGQGGGNTTSQFKESISELMAQFDQA